MRTYSRRLANADELMDIEDIGSSHSEVESVVEYMDGEEFFSDCKEFNPYAFEQPSSLSLGKSRVEVENDNRSIDKLNDLVDEHENEADDTIEDSIQETVQETMDVELESKKLSPLEEKIQAMQAAHRKLYLEGGLFFSAKDATPRTLQFMAKRGIGVERAPVTGSPIIVDKFATDTVGKYKFNPHHIDIKRESVEAFLQQKGEEDRYRLNHRW